METPPAVHPPNPQTITVMNLGMPEIVIIAIVVLFLFGGKKLPELMHGVGKGIRDFKKGMNGIEDEIKKDIDQNDTTDKK